MNPGKNAKMFWASSGLQRHAGIVALVFCALVSGCGRNAPEIVLHPKTVNDWFPIKVGGQMVQLQLAVFPAEMERGLMQRRDIGKDQGMLFIYRDPTQMSFWMRNTPSALDIGFFTAAGELKEIYTMLPYDETPIRSRSGALKFALEMNQGWYRENGVKPGAGLDLAAVREALKARDIGLEAIGLQ
jgi:hypothetical protein